MKSQDLKNRRVKMEYRTQTEIEMEKFKRREIIRELVIAGFEGLGFFVLMTLDVIVFSIIGG
jgi:hypothetical protein